MALSVVSRLMKGRGWKERRPKSTLKGGQDRKSSLSFPFASPRLGFYQSHSVRFPDSVWLTRAVLNKQYCNYHFKMTQGKVKTLSFFEYCVTCFHLNTQRGASGRKIPAAPGWEWHEPSSIFTSMTFVLLEDELSSSLKKLHTLLPQNVAGWWIIHNT